MPELCLCGDPACASCFPASYRQARAWERDQAVMDREEVREHRRITSPEPNSAGTYPAVPDASLYRRPSAPELCAWGCHDWDARGGFGVIIGVSRCKRCDKLSTIADFRSDLWDKPGDHERDMAGCGEGEE
ncbi:MAG: hypothetical protein V1790_17420 [Planctomycetota bacterium]